MEASPLEKARSQAFRLLSLRARSEKELRDRLSENHGRNVVDDVIGQLKEGGYLHDGNFARERARRLAVGQMKGNRAIEADLLQKGVDRTVIAEAIRAVREELSEPDAVRKLLEKKRSGLSSPPDLPRREKMKRYLLSKGFPAGLIFEILNER